MKRQWERKEGNEGTLKKNVYTLNEREVEKQHFKKERDGKERKVATYIEYYKRKVEKSN